MPADVIPLTRTLAEHTSVELIIPQLRGNDVPSVVQELTRALYACGRISDTLTFYHAALNMETLHSSAMEYGIAFPHARVPDVKQACFALGRSAQPIRWRDDGRLRDIHLVFLMALPADESGDYISVVLSVGHLHSEPETMTQLLKGKTAGDMFSALQRVPLNSPAGARVR